jgi:hypothetical protein
MRLASSLAGTHNASGLVAIKLRLSVATDNLPIRNPHRMSQPRRILTYSSRGPQRLLTFRRTIGIVGAAGLLLVAWMCAPVAIQTWNRLKILREQSKWMNYDLSPSQIVVLHDGAGPSGNTGSVQAKQLMATSAFTLSGGTMTRSFTPLDTFLTSAGTARSASLWGQEGMVFCGVRSCPAGKRLVVVSFRDTGNWVAGGKKAFIFSADVFVPGGMKSSPTNVRSGSTADFVGYFRLQPTDSVRIFAGQRDPSDPSRITIRYTLNNIEGAVDASLQPDGSKVVFALRSGPLFPLSAQGRPIPKTRTKREGSAHTKRGLSDWMAYHAPGDQLVIFQGRVGFALGDMRLDECPEADALLEKNPDFVVSYVSGDANWIVGRVNAELDGFLASTQTSRTLPFGSNEPGPLLFSGLLGCKAGDRFVAVSFYSKRFWTDDRGHEAFVFSADTGVMVLDPSTRNARSPCHSGPPVAPVISSGVA